MDRESAGNDRILRKQQVIARRKIAAELSTRSEFPIQTPNNDELKYKPSYIFNFTKGLLHDIQGLLNDPKDYENFANALQTSDPHAFTKVKLNDALNTKRKFESPTGGHAYVLEGPDAMALAMPPAPEAGSNELAAELAEVYQMALHRDFPVAAFMDSSLVTSMMSMGALSTKETSRLDLCHQAAKKHAARLSSFQWFKGNESEFDKTKKEHHARRRFGKEQTIDNIYRGVAVDDQEGPFVSQFMLMGTEGDPADGEIRYGNQRIDQKVRIAKPNLDYMTTWTKWLYVQNAGDPSRDDEFVRENRDPDMPDMDSRFLRRPITTLRDLATYVHDDQLYQAYLNAALILLEMLPGTNNVEIDPGIPYHINTNNSAGMPDGVDPKAFRKQLNQKPFAVFGGPHLLTLVTEVASRALRAVRQQKFTVHRRLRPEALAALMHTAYSGYNPSGTREFGAASDGNAKSVETSARNAVGQTIARYAFAPGNESEPSEPLFDAILTEIREHNRKQNDKQPTNSTHLNHHWLLPMAFPEGSPMHPAYGAGHATVAGACVSMLKAFFDMGGQHRNHKTMLVERDGLAFVPTPGQSPGDVNTKVIGVPVPKGLTIEGELNKLAWNISNARNIAGVHYFTDYIESLILGEDITIGILIEQMTCYDISENVSMTLPLFVKRRLPPVFGVDPNKEFEIIKINPDGTITDALSDH